MLQNYSNIKHFEIDLFVQNYSLMPNSISSEIFILPTTKCRTDAMSAGKHSPRPGGRSTMGISNSTGKKKKGRKCRYGGNINHVPDVITLIFASIGISVKQTAFGSRQNSLQIMRAQL